MGQQRIFLLFALSLCLLLLGHAREVPQGQETLEVHLQILPFFAVDREGNPVTDLRREEVKILLNGREVPLAHLDRYVYIEKNLVQEKNVSDRMSGSVTTDMTSHAISQRNVLIVVDVSFLDRLGFRDAKGIIEEFVSRLRENDRVYLIVNSDVKGLRPLWGPVIGRNEVIEKVGRTLKMGLTSDRLRKLQVPTFFNALDTGVFQKDDAGVPEPEIQRNFEDCFDIFVTCSIARNFARQMESLTLYLSTLKGPKLLFLFSMGVPRGLYALSGRADQGMTKQKCACNLYMDFEKALLQLQNSGVISFFINPSVHRMEYGESTLPDMASRAGGLYLAGADRKAIAKRMITWTSAYYEAGIYLRGEQLHRGVHRVDIRVQRPGVRVIGPRRFRAPRAYREFTPVEKVRYALELVRKAQYNVYGREMVRLRRRTEKVWFEGLWAHYRVPTPKELVGRWVDLYSILIESNEQRWLLKMLDGRVENVRVSERLAAEVELPGPGYYVWGIVVLDPERDRFWMRRLFIRVPEAKGQE